jgi:selenide,water dikinase
MATNDGLRPGDALVLTKPIGTGVLATGLKADWEGAERFDETLHAWCSRLNTAGPKLVAECGVRGMTDVTGFGLGGHLLEMAQGSGVSVLLRAEDVPVFDEALELVDMGLLPAGSHANRDFCSSVVQVDESVDAPRRDLLFDAQTSGGLLFGVPSDRLAETRARMREWGEPCWVIGQVAEAKSLPAVLTIR